VAEQLAASHEGTPWLVAYKIKHDDRSGDMEGVLVSSNKYGTRIGTGLIWALSCKRTFVCVFFFLKVHNIILYTELKDITIISGRGPVVNIC
jgi:hypothetical protein